MARGRIVSIQVKRGFGFIQQSPGGADIYFHWTSITAGSLDQLREGQVVEFDLTTDPRDANRQIAANLRLAE